MGSDLSTRDVSNHNLPTPKVSPTKCWITICQKIMLSKLCTKKQQNAEKKMQNFLGTKTLLGTWDVLIKKTIFFI